MVVVLLVKSKSILSYEILDSGIQLNVITYDIRNISVRKFTKTAIII